MDSPTPTPIVDLSSLEASPAAQLGWLAVAVSRGDIRAIRRTQQALLQMGFLVLTPGDLEHLDSAEVENSASMATDLVAEESAP